MMAKIAAIYGAIVTIYLLLILIKKDKNILLRVLMITFIPLFGLVFFLIVDILEFANRRKNVKVVDAIADKQNAVVTSVSTLHRRDILPLADILNQNDVLARRKKLLREINGDIAKTSKYLKKALKDSDSEVSHYAAAVIMGARQRMVTDTIEIKKKLDKSKDCKILTERYIRALIKYIESGIFSEDDVKIRREELASLLDKVFEIKEAKNKNFDLSKYEMVTLNNPRPLTFATMHWAKLTKVFSGLQREPDNGIRHQDVLDTINGIESNSLVKTRQIERGACLKAFDEWKKKIDRVDYGTHEMTRKF